MSLFESSTEHFYTNLLIYAALPPLLRLAISFMDSSTYTENLLNVNLTLDTYKSLRQLKVYKIVLEDFISSQFTHLCSSRWLPSGTEIYSSKWLENLIKHIIFSIKLNMLINVKWYSHTKGENKIIFTPSLISLFKKAREGFSNV